MKGLLRVLSVLRGSSACAIFATASKAGVYQQWIPACDGVAKPSRHLVPTLCVGMHTELAACWATLMPGSVSVSVWLFHYGECGMHSHAQRGNETKKAFASGHVCLAGQDPILESMKLVFSQPAVSSAIVGTINPDHIRQNVAACIAATG